MARLVWTRHSRRNLKAIRSYIAKDSPSASKSFIERLMAAAERLKSFPFSGSVVPELNREEIREILFGNYRIVHRASRERVEILTVYHAARLLDETALSE